MKKNSENPAISSKNTFIASASSKASGRRCRNAPPINAPADNETMNMRILSRRDCLRANVKTPTREITLSKKVLRMIHKRVFIIPYHISHLKSFLHHGFAQLQQDI